MINKQFLFYSVAIACAISVNNVKSADIAFNTAHMQAMDKITGRVSEIDVPVNGLANFGTFSILVRKCIGKSPEETPENTAFVDVVDNYQTAEPINIFKGWMFSSTPALNAVEHPIYDIWLLKCYNRAQERAKLLTTEQLALRDTIKMVRPEPIEVSTEINSAEDEIEEPLPTEANTDKETTLNNEEDFASEGEEDIPLPVAGIEAIPMTIPAITPSETEDNPTTDNNASPNEVIIIKE